MKPANRREPNRVSSNSANTEEWFYIDEPEKGWIRYQDPSSLWFWWHNESLGLCELILLQSIANLMGVLNDSSHTFSSARRTMRIISGDLYQHLTLFEMMSMMNWMLYSKPAPSKKLQSKRSQPKPTRSSARSTIGRFHIILMQRSSC